MLGGRWAGGKVWNASVGEKWVYVRGGWYRGGGEDWGKEFEGGEG